MKNKKSPNLFKLLLTIVVYPFIFSCRNPSNDYEFLTPSQKVQKEINLSEPYRNDSTIIGLRFGMNPAQVDSAFEQAIKDKVVSRSGNGYIYDIVQKDFVEGFTSTVSTNFDESKKLVEIDLFFVDEEYEFLKKVYTKKYGQPKIQYTKNNDEFEILLFDGKAVELLKNKYSPFIHVNYKDINYLYQQFTKEEQEEEAKIQQEQSEREKKLKSKNGGIKAFDGLFSFQKGIQGGNYPLEYLTLVKTFWNFSSKSYSSVTPLQVDNLSKFSLSGCFLCLWSFVGRIAFRYSANRGLFF